MMRKGIDSVGDLGKDGDVYCDWSSDSGNKYVPTKIKS